MPNYFCPFCEKDFTEVVEKIGIEGLYWHRSICCRDQEIRRLREQLEIINQEAKRLGELLKDGEKNG